MKDQLGHVAFLGSLTTQYSNSDTTKTDQGVKRPTEKCGHRPNVIQNHWRNCLHRYTDNYDRRDDQTYRRDEQIYNQTAAIHLTE